MGRVAAKSALLLSPGAVSAVGLLLFPLGVFPGLPKAVATEFLVFLPWHLLSLTACKFGLDTWVLARAPQWAGASLRLHKFLLLRAVPATVAISALLASKFTPTTIVLGALCIISDVVALIISAELAGQGQIARAASGHFLKYPLFFLVVFIWGFSGPLNLEQILLAFAASSVARALYYFYATYPLRQVPFEWPPLNLMLGQQILNYGLFKNDQLSFAFLGPTTSTQDSLVFYARFPEFLSAIVVALAPVLYPAYLKLLSQPWRSSMLGAVCLVYLSAIAAAVWGYSNFAPDTGLSIHLPSAAIIAHAALILPVNAQTFKMFKDGAERRLLFSLSWANLGGMSFIAAVFSMNSDSSMILIAIPVQQAVFLLSARLLTRKRTNEHC